MVAGIAMVAVLVPGGAAEAATAKGVNLKATQAIKTRLADKYYTAYGHQLTCAKRSKVVGPKNLYYGKVVTKGKKPVYWAVGGIWLSCNPLSKQDGPHVWRKTGDKGAWVYKGDTGGDLCKVPKAMLKAWKLTCYDYRA